MIPKKIHYCWLGGKELPESAKKCIKSWQKYCPDYEIVEWNESNYDFTKNEYMRQALEAKKWGFVPDYARLDIIYTYGGIYLDVDVEIVRSFDPLLSLSGFAGFESGTDVNLGQGFGAQAGDSVIKALLDSYESLTFKKPDGSLDLTASPALNSDTLESLGLKRNGEMQEIDGFKIFPMEYFCPKSLLDGVLRKTENTYSIHHFDGSWLSEAGQKQKELRWKRGKKREAKHRHKALRAKILNTVLGEEKATELKKKLGLIK